MDKNTNVSFFVCFVHRFVIHVLDKYRTLRNLAHMKYFFNLKKISLYWNNMFLHYSFSIWSQKKIHMKNIYTHLIGIFVTVLFLYVIISSCFTSLLKWKQAYKYNNRKNKASFIFNVRNNFNNQFYLFFSYLHGLVTVITNEKTHNDTCNF